jgi:predicted trehalose synthase
LYEIRYELGSRPELVTVPLADLRALLEAQPGAPAPPAPPRR